MLICLDDKKWVPGFIGHHNAADIEEKCPFCNITAEHYSTCEVLTIKNNLDEVFEKVMNHSKVRLRKLFF